MAQVDVTWTRAFKVYWSMLWRATLYTIAPLGALSAIIYYLMTEAPDGIDAATSADATLGAMNGALPLTPEILIPVAILAIIVVPTWIVKTVLGRAYVDFRIVLEAPPKRFKIEPRL